MSCHQIELKLSKKKKLKIHLCICVGKYRPFSYMHTLMRIFLLS